MANQDTPRGAYPVYSLTGANDLGRTIKMYVKASQTIYNGDIVSVDATGTVVASSVDDGVIVAGVASEYKVGNASGTTEIAIYPAHWYAFCIQADSGSTPAATDRWATANHVAGSGSATTKMSGHELDSSDIGTGIQMRIIDKLNVSGNAWGEHVDLVVVLNEHIFADNGATV
jgi:hypothetical protein